jgi:queuosine precursor transporter
MNLDKKQKLYIILTSLFLTFLLLAELTGFKLITLEMGWLFIPLGLSSILPTRFIMTMGVIPFPMTFLITDILNEFYGKKIVRFTTFIGMAMIAIAYVLILIDLQIPANEISPVDDVSFEKVFANAGLVILGSIIAYLIGQLIDIQVFHFIRQKTGGKMVWLRATGSTIISQLIDSFVVIFIAFGKYEPSILFGIPFYKITNTNSLINISSTNFIYKLIIVILLTPVIYLLHSLIEKYLGSETIDN